MKLSSRHLQEQRLKEAACPLHDFNASEVIYQDGSRMYWCYLCGMTLFNDKTENKWLRVVGFEFKKFSTEKCPKCNYRSAPIKDTDENICLKCWQKFPKKGIK